MKSPDSSCKVVVTSPEQCRLLLSEAYRGLIKALMLQPRTLTELASVLSLSMDKVYYRVKHLERLELVKVVREEKRRGKPLKYYAMTADRYEVPFTHAPDASLNDLILGQLVERQEVFKQYLIEHLLAELQSVTGHPSFFIESQGGDLVLDLKVPEKMNSESTTIYWRSLHMRRSDVGRLFEEMVALTKRYSEQCPPDERVEHLIGIQLVRRP